MRSVNAKKIQEKTMKIIYYGWIPLIIALGLKSARGNVDFGNN